MVAELLVLALDYHRYPLRYRNLAKTETPLPPEFAPLLADFCVALAPRNIDAAADALKVSSQELEDASLFFLRQVLLAPGADHYRVLGLARAASQEAVKKHYSLMVRMFHPDRRHDESERSPVLTARINAAYRMLRTADSRRQYDRLLDGRLRGTGDALELVELLRPCDPTPKYLKPERLPVHLVWGGRRTLAWSLIGLFTAFLVLWGFRSTESPRLRVNPKLASGSTLGPAYLQNGLPEPFRSETIPSPARGAEDQVNRERGPLAVPSGQGGASHGRPLEGTGTRAQTEVDLLLRQLIEFYERGDLDGLVGLFTVEASTNSGSGGRLVRSDYADLFSTIPRRRLSFSEMRWRIEEYEVVSGQGRFRVSSLLEGEKEWRHGVGNVRFELVPWDGSYRVSHMTHSVDRQ